jgi:hypothetical protein
MERGSRDTALAPFCDNHYQPPPPPPQITHRSHRQNASLLSSDFTALKIRRKFRILHFCFSFHIAFFTFFISSFSRSFPCSILFLFFSSLLVSVAAWPPA